MEHIKAVGKIYGFLMTIGAWCNSGLKVNPLMSYQKEVEGVSYIESSTITSIKKKYAKHKYFYYILYPSKAKGMDIIMTNVDEIKAMMRARELTGEEPRECYGAAQARAEKAEEFKAVLNSVNIFTAAEITDFNKRARKCVRSSLRSSQFVPTWTFKEFDELCIKTQAVPQIDPDSEFISYICGINSLVFCVRPGKNGYEFCGSMQGDSKKDKIFNKFCGGTHNWSKHDVESLLLNSDFKWDKLPAFFLHAINSDILCLCDSTTRVEDYFKESVKGIIEYMRCTPRNVTVARTVEILEEALAGNLDNFDLDLLRECMCHTTLDDKQYVRLAGGDYEILSKYRNGPVAVYRSPIRLSRTDMAKLIRECKLEKPYKNKYEYMSNDGLVFITVVAHDGVFDIMHIKCADIEEHFMQFTEYSDVDSIIEYVNRDKYDYDSEI